MPLTRLIRRFTGNACEPKRINRGVILLKAKAPMLEWVAEVGELSLEQARAAMSKDGTGYLVPVSGSAEPDRKVLNAVFRKLFEQELAEWCEEKKQWPRPLSRALFNQWFDIVYCDLVLDLDNAPLEWEEWED